MLRIFRNKPDPLSDQDLLERYRNTHDLEYLGTLYERYVELVYGVCLKYLKNETEAEDAVMIIFEELIGKVKKHRVEQFRNWLHVLTRNHCLMKLRREKKNLTVSYDPEIMHSVDEMHPIFELPEESNGEIESLQDCMKQLDEKQKACVDLFYLQGKSYKEIAVLRKEEVGKVRSYIQNGRRNLKNCIEQKMLKEGIEEEPSK